MHRTITAHVARLLNNPTSERAAAMYIVRKHRTLPSVPCIEHANGRGSLFLKSFRPQYHYFHTNCYSLSSGVQPSGRQVTSVHSEPRARMLIAFTCKVCSHRAGHAMSKHAYSHGVVIIQCPQ